MAIQKTPVPVLLGADLNAYSVATAFHEAAGCVSEVFGRYACGITRHCRYIFPHTEPDLCNAQTLTAVLRGFSEEREGGPFLLVPCADWYAEALENCRDFLPPSYHFLIPERSLFRRVANKAEFYRILEGFSVPYPESFILSAQTNERSFFARGNFYPAVLKPDDSSEYWRHPFPGMRKVYFPSNALEAYETACRIFAAGYGGRLILQRKIGAERERLSVLTTFSDRQGKVVRAVLGDVLWEETAPRAVGNHAVILTRPLHRTAFALIRMLNALRYTGIANFDIISDEDTAYVLELNPRQGRSSDYCRAAGVNLAQLLLRDYYGERISPDFSYRRVLWHSAPLPLVRECVEEGEFGEEARTVWERAWRADPFSYEQQTGAGPVRRIYLAIHGYRQKKVLEKYRERSRTAPDERAG